MAKIIGNELVQALVNYLATRPYQEVHQVMPLLLNLTDYTAPVSPETPIGEKAP
jgi:hypothetical protein